MGAIKMETTEERISELENGTMESSQYEQQMGKKWRFSGPCGIINKKKIQHSNQCDLKEKEKESGTKSMSKIILTGCPKFAERQFWKSWMKPNQVNPKKSNSRDICLWK